MPRQVVAVAIGVFLLNFMDSSLQQILVNAFADAPPTDEASYLAVRNRPLVSGLFVVTHAFAAALVGYIVAKIAAAREVRLAVVAAVILTVEYLLTFFGTPARVMPVWVLPTMLIVTPPALVGGAYVRAEARAIRMEQAATPRPEERS